MSRHYWPTEPGRYLLEKSSGEVHFATLCENGTWQGDCYLNAFVRDLSKKGYLGVRTPLSEEAERAAFEAEYRNRWPKDGVIQRDKNGAYIHAYASIAFEWWLLAKRHERGL